MSDSDKVTNAGYTNSAEYFTLDEAKPVFQCPIFRAFERTAHTQDKQHELKVYTLACTNWVNIVPVTSAGQIILVEQHRFGTDTLTLEVPGGAVHKDEKDLTLAALRELEEETGFTTQRLVSLPGFAPNPAIQNNKVTYFIAYDIQPLAKPSDHFDPFEKIKLHVVSVKEALQMTRTGQISHALSALALLLAEPYLTKYN